MKGELGRTGADAFRITPAALDLRVAVAGGLATTAPLAIGLLVGQPLAGVTAALGGLNVALAMPDVGNRHRLWWGILALVGCTVTTLLARAVAPVAVISVALTLVWTGGFALLRAAGKEGAGVGFVLGAMFVILNGLPSQSSMPALTVQAAAGGLAGLAIMVLAGLGRGASRVEPAPTLLGIVRGVGVAVRRDATLRGHGLRVGLATAFAAALASVLGPSFGYWIPLTVIAVLQPDSHSSRVRLLQRAAGTVVGVVLVVLVTVLTENPAALVVLVALFSLAMFALKDRSYFWMVILLTPTALLMISSAIVEGPGIAGQRLVNTAIGLAIGLVAMNLPWRGADAS